MYVIKGEADGEKENRDMKGHKGEEIKEKERKKNRDV